MSRSSRPILRARTRCQCRASSTSTAPEEPEVEVGERRGAERRLVVDREAEHPREPPQRERLGGAVADVVATVASVTISGSAARTLPK